MIDGATVQRIRFVEVYRERDNNTGAGDEADSFTDHPHIDLYDEIEPRKISVKEANQLVQRWKLESVWYGIFDCYDSIVVKHAIPSEPPDAGKVDISVPLHRSTFSNRDQLDEMFEAYGISPRRPSSSPVTNLLDG